MHVRSGLQIVVELLKKRFMPLDQEQQIRVLNEFFMFRRDRSEDVDSLLTRFELMNYRAQTVSGLALNIVGKSWLILHHMGIPKEKWPLLLAPTQGMLPSTEEQYNAFLEYCSAMPICGRTSAKSHCNPGTSRRLTLVTLQPLT